MGSVKVRKVNGMFVVEPGNTPVKELVDRAAQRESIDSIKASVGAPDDNHWRPIAEAMFSEWKVQCDGAIEKLGCTNDGEDHLMAATNAKLADHALAFPDYGTVSELKRINALLDKSPPDLDAISSIIFAAVMNPRIRALQLIGRFRKLRLFDEFAYFIDSAAIAFYRGNVVAAFMTIVPIIEGILLRWQGINYPDFKKTKTFIGRSLYRQPIPIKPHFQESFVKAADGIIQNHFYKDTSTGSAHENFNRHLALHMLEDKKFYSHGNVMRTFLLLDLLTEIYINEHHIADPRWDVTREQEFPHVQSYINALSFQGPNSSEAILFSHERHMAPPGMWSPQT